MFTIHWGKNLNTIPDRIYPRLYYQNITVVFLVHKNVRFLVFLTIHATHFLKLRLFSLILCLPELYF